MIDNIKKIRKALLTKYKDLATRTTMDQFGLTSEQYFLQHWLYQNKMPVGVQEKVLTIHQNAMRKQNDENPELLGT